MATRVATPSTLQGMADRLRPGDVLDLAPGFYDRPLVLQGIVGTAAEPICIRGQAGVVFDGGLPMPSSRNDPSPVRRLAREALARLDPGIDFPGVYRHSDDGFIRLLGCSFVLLQGFALQHCWPTSIAIRDSNNLEFRDLAVTGGAYAIQARGLNTKAIRIERCAWLQDATRRFLWKELNWADVHGNWGEAAREADGGVNSFRCFDGSFFNANEIAGQVEIVDCTVEHAFNGVHLFNADRREDLSVGVRVHGCTFSHIKDNPIEAEQAAWDWWIHDNVFHNCHKWLSLELKKVGWIYVFRNRAWADDRPGPPEDANGSGAVFKFHPKADKPKIAKSPIYVFHNSWALRSTLVQEGFVRGLEHFNNAMRIYRHKEAGREEPVYWRWTPFFGKRDAAAPERQAPPADFTREWTKFRIRFFGDVSNHPQYPDALREAGYAIAGGLRADPKFKEPFSGDLTPADDSPCRKAGMAASIMLKDEIHPFVLPAGLDVGWQPAAPAELAALAAKAPTVPRLA